MDYEWNGLESVNVEYEGIRPSFEETFSPSLPAGLNFGKQLFWQQKNFSFFRFFHSQPGGSPDLDARNFFQQQVEQNRPI